MRRRLRVVGGDDRDQRLLRGSTSFRRGTPRRTPDRTGASRVGASCPRTTGAPLRALEFRFSVLGSLFTTLPRARPSDHGTRISWSGRSVDLDEILGHAAMTSLAHPLAG